MVGRLPLGQRLAFGVGDLGINVYWNAANLFLLFFYTEVLGLAPGTAGAVMLAALIWDAVTDPVVGALAERVRTPLGRYRPFLLAAPLPLALCLGAAFWSPGVEAGLWAYALGTQMLLRTLHTLVAVPYNALPARITADSEERARLTGLRMMGAMIGTLLAAVGFLPLAQQIGYAAAGLATGLVGAGVVMLTGATLREPADPVGPDAGASALRAPPLSETLRMVGANPPFWIVLAAFVLITLSNGVFQATATYYCAYVLGDAALVSALLGVSIVGATFGAAAWGALVPRLGRRRVLTLGLGLSAASLGAIWLADRNVAATLAALFLGGFGAISGGVVCFSALPDTSEYGEWRTGTRSEALLVGLLVFAQKAAVGLSAFFVAIGLQVVGYEAGAAPEAGTALGLRVMLVAVPAGFTLAAILVFLRYDLGAARHAGIVRELRARRAGEAHA